MRAVIQRVSEAKVRVEGELLGAIDLGFLVLLGIGIEDTWEDAERLAHKIAGLRVFPDQSGKMSLSLAQVGGEVLLVSQFTIYGDLKRGFRPSFTRAATPEMGKRLYERFIDFLTREGVTVQTGVFGAHMQVSLVNDGPVTLIIESPA
jgi:D-tyrosyl-tRNA(Tyr) deacylase